MDLKTMAIQHGSIFSNGWVVERYISFSSEIQSERRWEELKEKRMAPTIWTIQLLSKSSWAQDQVNQTKLKDWSLSENFDLIAQYERGVDYKK